VRSGPWDILSKVQRHSRSADVIALTFRRLAAAHHGVTVE
jgi:hypothetical protein